AVERSMRQQRISELTTILESDVAAIRAWLADQQTTADLMARDERLLPFAQELLADAGATPDLERRLILAPGQKALRERLSERLQRYGFIGFVVVAPSGVVVAADQDP